MEDQQKQTEFPILDFNLDDIDVRAERSKYPFADLQVGQGFQIFKPVSSVSGRVSAENKKGEAVFVTRTARESTKENPVTNVIRVK